MVAKRVVAVCEACGQGYAARKVEDEIVVATNDGRCACGNEGFITEGEQPGEIVEM